MKFRLPFAATALLILLAGCTVHPVVYHDPNVGSDRHAGQERAESYPAPSQGEVYFEEDLAPYGRWTLHVDLGRVWQPYGVSSGWRPYSHGHWSFGNHGWTWNSNYPWGHIAFHYGRWYLDQLHGWLWISGNEWSPAWVSWRRDDHWVGWAPLPPRIRGGHAHEVVRHQPQPQHYHFVQREHFTKREIARHLLAPKRNQQVYESTREITRYPADDKHEVVRSTTRHPAMAPTHSTPPKATHSDGEVVRSTTRHPSIPPSRSTSPKATYPGGEAVRTVKPNHKGSPPSRSGEVVRQPYGGDKGAAPASGKASVRHPSSGLPGRRVVPGGSGGSGEQVRGTPTKGLRSPSSQSTPSSHPYAGKKRAPAPSAKGSSQPREVVRKAATPTATQGSKKSAEKKRVMTKEEEQEFLRRIAE